ncbi:MAG: hypothetical protein WB239_05090 [Acidimicrobiia bacterium]
MRRWIARLPGPPVVRYIEAVVIVAILLVLVGFLFEWAGNLLDSGGAIAR